MIYRSTTNIQPDLAGGLQKADLWTHCSVFEVWDNIPAKQVEELEGLFRHLFRRDAVANRLNKQKAYAPLTKLTKSTKTASNNAP